MAVIKQLNEHKGTVTAVVEVDGRLASVEINKAFKSHLERNEEIVKKAKELLHDSGD